jgi:hypothetical protein
VRAYIVSVRGGGVGSGGEQKRGGRLIKNVFQKMGVTYKRENVKDT